MRARLWLNLGVAVLLTFSGCKREHGHDEASGGHGHAHGADGSHSDAIESFSGATHQEGKGITLLDETRKLLGIQTAEVHEQKLPRENRFVARVFGAAGREIMPVGNKSSVKQLALGTVSAGDAALLRAGVPMRFKTASGATITGEVQRVTRPLANDEAEIIVALHPATPPLKDGEFGEVTVSVPGEKSVLVVPRESVIRGATGDLVYVVNGDAYLLTWIEVGATADGLVEVTDGLLVGDSVVTRGAMDLWLVELRAVKGGQGCCPAPPAKGKK